MNLVERLEKSGLSLIMKIVGFGLLMMVGFSGVGCTQFRENLEQDQREHTISGISDLQTEQVEEFSSAGQLNDFETEQMNRAISGE